MTITKTLWHDKESRQNFRFYFYFNMLSKVKCLAFQCMFKTSNKVLGAFAVNFEQDLQIQQVLLSLTLIKCMFSECIDNWSTKHKCPISIPPENVRKSQFLWRFKGLLKYRRFSLYLEQCKMFLIHLGHCSMENAGILRKIFWKTGLIRIR